MRFDDEITRAIKHQVALDTSQPQKTDEELAAVEEAVRTAVSSGTYDFSNATSQVLTQPGGKKRYIKQFVDGYSIESIM